MFPTISIAHIIIVIFNVPVFLACTQLPGTCGVNATKIYRVFIDTLYIDTVYAGKITHRHTMCLSTRWRRTNKSAYTAHYTHICVDSSVIDFMSLQFVVRIYIAIQSRFILLGKVL